MNRRSRGDRLAGREDLERELVDLVLVAIDRRVVLDHLAREVVVALGERLHRERDLLLAASAHRAQPLAQRAQLVARSPCWCVS